MYLGFFRIEKYTIILGKNSFTLIGLPHYIQGALMDLYQEVSTEYLWLVHSDAPAS